MDTGHHPPLPDTDTLARADQPRLRRRCPVHVCWLPHTPPRHATPHLSRCPALPPMPRHAATRPRQLKHPCHDMNPSRYIQPGATPWPHCHFPALNHLWCHATVLCHATERTLINQHGAVLAPGSVCHVHLNTYVFLFRYVHR